MLVISRVIHYNCHLGCMCVRHISQISNLYISILFISLNEEVFSDIMVLASPPRPPRPPRPPVDPDEVNTLNSKNIQPNRLNLSLSNFI